MNVNGGDTDVSAYFDLVLLTGGDATGLTETDFDLTYTRNGSAPSAKVDATAGTAGGAAAHSDNTIVEPDPADAPGMWRVDFPDAAFAAGVKSVVLTVRHDLIKTANKEVLIDSPVNSTKVGGQTASATGTVDFDDVATLLTDVATLLAGTITGQAQTGTLSTTQATTDLSGYADDELIGRILVWTGGTAAGQATDITDYASASGLLTFSAMPTAPVNGDAFKIV